MKKGEGIGTPMERKEETPVQNKKDKRKSPRSSMKLTRQFLRWKRRPRRNVEIVHVKPNMLRTKYQYSIENPQKKYSTP
jgi:hypothetical protein